MSLPYIPEQEHCSTKRTESSLEIYSEVSEHFYETTADGQGTQQQPTETVLLSKWGPNIHIPSFRNDTEHTTVPPFQSDEERL